MTFKEITEEEVQQLTSQLGTPENAGSSSEEGGLKLTTYFKFSNGILVKTFFDATTGEFKCYKGE